MASAQTIYTIGYSGFKIEDFCDILLDFNISAVIDVRSQPFSAHFKDYDRDALAHTLQINRIHYRNYAREFGARQTEPQYLSPAGYLDFEKFAQSAAFLSGTRKLMDSMAQGYRFVLMCAEEDPTQCHRAAMVSRTFAEAGYDVQHILPHGICLSQSVFESQLIARYIPDGGQLQLFNAELPQDDEELLRLAYRRCNEEIGWRPSGTSTQLNDQVGHA